MDDQLERLRHQLTDWLRQNELDGDLNFWTPNEWTARQEEYLTDAALVITTEGGLNFLLNYTNDHVKVGEFQDLLDSFGYWFEMGHSWSVGLYRNEQFDAASPARDYRAKLLDSRWKSKAKRVKERARWRCQDCDASEVSLEAHHCWYRYGFEPWQYPLDSLRCLCRTCHSRRAQEEHDIRCLAAGFRWKELAELRECLLRMFYWFDRSACFEFLNAIGADETNLKSAAGALARRKTEPGRT